MNTQNIFIQCSKIAVMLVLISFSFLAQAIQIANPANTISGFIWLDNNDNGLQEPDEPGFAQTVPGFGAPNISLYTTGNTTAPIDVSSLDESSNGEYSFENVPDGNYYVCVSNEFRPLGLTVTTPNAGDDTLDSDFDFFACSYDISITGGQIVIRDLGLAEAIPEENQISGFVWLDNNGNGLQDSGESGFAQTVPDFGAPNVALYPTGSTTVIDTFSLDESSNGEYSFENVADGNYYVCVSNEFRPLGLTVTTPNAGDDTIDSDFDFFACSYNISVIDGQVVLRDLGLVKEAIDPAGNSISGFIWLDNNGDGLQESDEPGFAQTVPGFGAPNVALYPTGSTTLIETFSLDESSNGEYSFENVADGNYYVCVSNEFRPLGLTVTTPNAGDDTIDSDFDFFACSYNISVIGGQVAIRDLGLKAIPTETSKISSDIWTNHNADSIWQQSFPETEFGIDSITMAIFRSGNYEPTETTVTSVKSLTDLRDYKDLGRFSA